MKEQKERNFSVNENNQKDQRKIQCKILAKIFSSRKVHYTNRFSHEKEKKQKFCCMKTERSKQAPINVEFNKIQPIVLL